MKNKMTSEINKGVALVSLFSGVLAWFTCRYLYYSLHDRLSGPVLMAMLFSLLFLITFFSVIISSLITGSFNKDSLLYDGVYSIFHHFAFCILVISILSGSLEYLYELNPHTMEFEPSSYIFVLDESGSMEDNDPNGLRYKAIPDIVREKGNCFPYMIYAFSNNSKILRQMAPLSTGAEDIPVTNSGGTSIRGTLLRILQDYKKGVWNGGDNPKVILLTDGYATDLDNGFLWFRGNVPEFNETLEEFSELEINISTVGLGNVDQELMRKIAETTGGIFINVHNTANLSDAMKTAAISYADRNLLSIRYMRHFDRIYGILRIFFLSIIGAILGSMFVFAFVQDESIPVIILSSVICAVLGSIAMEVGLKAGVLQNLLWLFLWILFSITLGYLQMDSFLKQINPAITEHNHDFFLHSY